MPLRKTIKRKRVKRHRSLKNKKSYHIKSNRKHLKSRNQKKQRGGENSRAQYQESSSSNGGKITSLNGQDPALQSGDVSINPGLLNVFMTGGFKPL
jgi:hypothetical protein